MTQNQSTPPTPKKKKGKKKWLWIALAVVVLVIGYLALTMESRIQESYQAETVQTRDLSTYYSFSGHLSPVTDEVQTAKDAIKVKELYVKEGDKVTAGQPLLRGLDGARVFAVEAGTVDQLFAEVDDQLQPGAQIAQIVDYDTLEVSVDVDEYDIGALTLGKEGAVYLNALDKNVTGTVSEISRSATTEGGVSYYEVKLQIDAADDIRSGMSVEVNVLNQQALSAASVPTKTLSYDEGNKPYVLVKGADGQIAARSVTLGVSDGLYTQVTQGLQNGDTVYYMPDNLAGFYMMRRMSQQNMRTAMGE